MCKNLKIVHATWYIDRKRDALAQEKTVASANMDWLRLRPFSQDSNTMVVLSEPLKFLTSLPAELDPDITAFEKAFSDYQDWA